MENYEDQGGDNTTRHGPGAGDFACREEKMTGLEIGHAGGVLGN